MSTEKRGGPRPNAGRKKIESENKKVSLCIYQPEKLILEAGGPEVAKAIAITAIKKAAHRNKNK